MDGAQPLATDVACIHQSAPGLHDQQQQVQLVTSTSTASTSVCTPPSASSNASPAKGNPKLLQLLGESVELMSTVLNSEHMDCQDTQAQLQAQLHNIKQQLQGTEMQMDRPRSDSTDDTWQVQDTNDRDVAAGASTDQQQPAACAVSLPAKEKPFTCTPVDGCPAAQPGVTLEPRDDAVSSAASHATCSKSGTPTAASTSSGLPPRPPAPPAVAAAAQEQAAALATALSAVAAAAASQQLPVDTASNLAAALVRSASRARLCEEESPSTPAEPAAAPVSDASMFPPDAAAAAHDVFASDPSLDEPSVFAQPAAALLEILSEYRPVAAHELLLMAAVATEQLDPPSIAALKSMTSTTSLAQAASRAERPAPTCEPSQQALADALHAITVDKLSSAVSVPCTTPTAPPETSSTDSAGLQAAVRAALVNLPPGGSTTTVKASKSSHGSSTIDATARNGHPQRLPSAGGTALPATSDGANSGTDRSNFSHTLAKMLQQHMAHPEQTAAPVTVDAAAVVPLPALQPIKVALLRAAEGSSSSSQPGTPGDSQTSADVAASALTAVQCAGSLPRSGSNGSAGSSSSSSSSGGSVGDDAARIYNEDVALARMLLAAVEKSGQSGLMLAKLLHFTAADELDISNALSDSNMSPLQLLASYLHNIRIVSADAEAAAVDGGVSSCQGPAAPAQRELAERLLTNLVDTFCSMLPVEPPPASPADTNQTTAPAAQQQHQVTLVDTAQPAAGSGTAGCSTAASTTDSNAQVVALLSMLQAAAQPAPAPVAAPPAAAPLPAANNMAALLSSLLTQQPATQQPVVTASQPNALATLLQQLSSAQGAAAPAAVVPAAPAALPVATPVAGNDMASVLAAAMQVIAAQQQQEQQRAAMQAAMQTLVQQQHQQQQQQLAQQQLAQQHAAAAAAAVAAAGLSTPQNTGLDLQSLQLLASLQQQQQQQQHQAAVAEVLAQTNPANNQLIMQASVGLPPIAPSAATAAGAHGTAAAAAAARVDSQYSLQSVHSLSSLMPPSSGVPPSAASVSNTAPTVAGYNLQRQLSFTGSGANTVPPSLPPSLSQQQQQRAPSYGDSTGAAPWTLQGSDPAGLLSVSSLSTASANKAGSVASLASLNSQASTVNSAATGHQPASVAVAGSSVPVGTAAAVGVQPAPSSTPVEGHLAAAGQPNTAVSIPAVAAALAAAQQHPGTPPSPGPLTLYDGTAGFSGHGEAAALAQQNAAALAQMQSLEAAAAASQQQQVQAAQQHHAAAAAAAAAVVAAQQQVQAQQQQQMMNELLYGYQTNAAAAAAAVGSVQGMMGLPATSAPMGVHYGSFSAESVEWQLWQQQQQQQAQHPTQQP